MMIERERVFQFFECLVDINAWPAAEVLWWSWLCEIGLQCWQSHEQSVTAAALCLPLHSRGGGEPGQQDTEAWRELGIFISFSCKNNWAPGAAGVDQVSRTPDTVLARSNDTDWANVEQE